MNNTCFIFLIRRDHVLGLAAHLAAGIIALLVLTGAVRASGQPASSAMPASPVVAQR